MRIYYMALAASTSLTSPHSKKTIQTKANHPTRLMKGMNSISYMLSINLEASSLCRFPADQLALKQLFYSLVSIMFLPKLDCIII